MTHHISYQETQTLQELEEIKALQARHQKDKIPPELWATKGFVTATYTIALLEAMHRRLPAIIAKHHEKVVGYALVVDRAIIGHHPLLDDLFRQIDCLNYAGVPLATLQYTVVGQLCVDQEYSGQGVAQGLYKHYRNCYAAQFPYCITDVDRNNPRSLKSHLKAGFQIIGTLQYGGAEWDIVLWDWQKP